MRITYRDKRYSIDRVAYSAFLKEQGFSDAALSWLNIYVQEQCQGKPHTYGEFRAPDTIFLYTQDGPEAEINETLLHETRHYWQQVKREQQRHDAYQKLGGRAYQKFLREWQSEEYREQQREYWDRPCEQDARAYAAKFAKDRLFIRRVELATTCTVERIVKAGF